MKCPKCQSLETKVIDSRTVEGGFAIRRRRECEFCQHRFTTFEKRSEAELIVIKKDGTKELYDRQKLKKSIALSLAKRASFTPDTLDRLIAQLEQKRTEHGREISSAEIGSDVLNALQDIDFVAFVRFASVYLSFETPSDFTDLITRAQKSDESPKISD